MSTSNARWRCVLSAAELIVTAIFLLVSACSVSADSLQVADYPIGAFAVHEDMLQLAREEGFDVVHNYRFEEGHDTDAQLARYLDRAHSLGLKVLVGFERGINYTPERVSQRVERFRSHPSVWAWYAGDEPKAADHKLVTHVIEAIHTSDSGHPVIVASDDPVYQQAADMHFSYTYPIRDSTPADLISFHQSSRRSATLKRPFFSLLQAFNWAHYLPCSKDSKFRHPTIEEMRFMLYSGIANNARGVFFFSFQTLPADDDFRTFTAVPLINEFIRLRQIIRQGVRLGAIAGMEGLRPGSWAAWRGAAGVTVVLVNATASPQVLRLAEQRWILQGASIVPGGVEVPAWGAAMLSSSFTVPLP